VKKKIPFLILTVLILIFGGTYLYAFYSPGYSVAEIQINGTKKISPDEIRKKAEWCMGKNIFSLKLERIRDKLLTDVRLKNVHIYKIPPHAISIEVQEKTPVLWISLPTILPGTEDYGFFGLSVDQEIIPLDKDDISHDLPIVSGIDVGEFNGSSNRLLSSYQKYENPKTERVLEFYRMLIKNDPTALKLLAEINMADAPNLILYLLPFGNKVLIGPGDIEKKWNRVKTILSTEEKIEDLSCLDLRFDDQVVLTRSVSNDSSAQTNSSKHSPDKMGKHLKNKRG
jgi:cell division protein FtsQ